jgi:carboxymethylenebutenolidase
LPLNGRWLPKRWHTQKSTTNCVTGISSFLPTWSIHCQPSLLFTNGGAKENIRQAYQFLELTAGAPSIGSLGWCFGGGWSLNTALLFPDQLDATVIYYGQVTDDEAKLEPMNVPILGIFGAEDKGIPVESVRGFEQALENLRKDYEIEVYPGVGHAFANPSGNNYNAEAADQAWQRTVAFLNRHLTSADEE